MRYSLFCPLYEFFRGKAGLISTIVWVHIEVCYFETCFRECSKVIQSSAAEAERSNSRSSHGFNEPCSKNNEIKI